MTHNAEKGAPTMPTGERCPIGPLNAHTYNAERDECIWCGPNQLAWKPGRWVSVGDGLTAWSVIPPGDEDDCACGHDHGVSTTTCDRCYWCQQGGAS